MKIVCEGVELSDAVMKVVKACSTKTTNPILETIKIAAENDGVTLLATDGEIAIEKKIKAEVLEEGAVCVPGKYFSDFIKKLENVQIEMSTDAEKLNIRYGEADSCIQVLSAEDFPAIDMNIEETRFGIPAKDLKELIAKTTFCCAQDDSRPVLKGCLMEFGDKLEMVALDGYRLALASAPILAKSGERSIICPARTLSEIAKMLEKDDEEITLFAQGGMLLVSAEGTTVVSRLYQGDFIRKENVIPSQFSTVVTLQKSELIASAERAAILIRGDKNNLVTMAIDSDCVKVTSVSDFGNVDESVKAQVTGMEMTISMNAKYLLDALRALEEESVTISFNGAVSPFILQNAENKESLYLILPVRNAA